MIVNAYSLAASTAEVFGWAAQERAVLALFGEWKFPVLSEVLSRFILHHRLAEDIPPHLVRPILPAVPQRASRHTARARLDSDAHAVGAPADAWLQIVMTEKLAAAVIPSLYSRSIERTLTAHSAAGTDYRTR